MQSVVVLVEVQLPVPRRVVVQVDLDHSSVVVVVVGVVNLHKTQPVMRIRVGNDVLKAANTKKTCTKIVSNVSCPGS